MNAFAQDIEVTFRGRVGTSLVNRAEYAQLLPEAADIARRIGEREGKYRLPLFDLPERSDDLAEIHHWAERVRDRFQHLVVIGTGGSTLGAATLWAASRAARENGRQLQLHFLENTDPHTITSLLSRLKLKEIAFLAISKSGTTVETIVQTIMAIDRLEQAGLDVRDHLTVLTGPGASPLRLLAAHYACHSFTHDPELGGRYSVLSNVGLMPAAAAGYDIDALRRGAASVMKTLKDGEKSPAVQAGALHVAMARQGMAVHVMMPYADRLASFGRWFAQLWAESLGKQGMGSTPVVAIGAIDQHSQLQLYLDGPRDKLLTMLLLEQEGKGPTLPDALVEAAGTRYLKGHHLGDVIAAQQRATVETLIARGVPVRLWQLARLDAESLGALMMQVMLEIIITAGLMGLDPFDQPAVEESKILARNYLQG